MTGPARPAAGAVLTVVGTVLSLTAALGVLYVASQDLPPLAVFGAAGGVLAVLLILADPYLGLLLFLGNLYLRPGDRYEALAPLRLTLLVASLTLGLWLARYLAIRRPPLAKHLVNLDMIGYVGTMFWSTVAFSVREGLSYLFNSVLKELPVYLLITNLVRDVQRLRWLVWAVVLFSVINAADAVAGWRSGEFAELAGRAEAVGTLGDPNDLALALVIALPLALALTFHERHLLFRTVAGLTTAALLFGTLVTQSRGGMLGLAVVLFLEGYERLRKPRVRLLYAVFGVLVGLAFVNVKFAQRGAGLSGLGNDPNVYNRRGAWVAGMRMLIDHPLTGVGFGTFADHQPRYKPDWAEQVGITAHNSVALVAGELGVPGLFFFGLVLWHSWLAALRIRRRLRERERDPVTRDPLLAGIGFSLARMLIGWFVCGFFLSQAYRAWLFITLGLIVATDNLLAAEPERRLAGWRDDAPQRRIPPPPS